MNSVTCHDPAVAPSESRRIDLLLILCPIVTLTLLYATRPVTPPPQAIQPPHLTASATVAHPVTNPR